MASLPGVPYELTLSTMVRLQQDRGITDLMPVSMLIQKLTGIRLKYYTMSDSSHALSSAQCDSLSELCQPPAHADSLLY